MKITAQDMLRFGVIDRIIKEPVGGAHRDPDAMIAATGKAIDDAFGELRNLDRDAIRNLAAAKVPRDGPQLDSAADNAPTSVRASDPIVAFSGRDCR